jgi:hypothetical protein
MPPEYLTWQFRLKPMAYAHGGEGGLEVLEMHSGFLKKKQKKRLLPAPERKKSHTTALWLF